MPTYGTSITQNEKANPLSLYILSLLKLVCQVMEQGVGYACKFIEPLFGGCLMANIICFMKAMIPIISIQMKAIALVGQEL